MKKRSISSFMFALTVSGLVAVPVSHAAVSSSSQEIVQASASTSESTSDEQTATTTTSSTSEETTTSSTSNAATTTSSSSSIAAESATTPAQQKPVVLPAPAVQQKQTMITEPAQTVQIPEQDQQVIEHAQLVPAAPIEFAYNQSTEEFIQKIGEEARQVAHENDLYASIMLAQAILESASGNSSLAAEPNYNLFGIKGDYQGNSVLMVTQEDDGSGNLYSIDSAFRVYPSYKESLQDYADLLKKGLTGNSEFYQGVWKSRTTSYLDGTAYLTGRYATDTQYAEKLNKLIELYSLTEFDKMPEEAAEATTPAATVFRRTGQDIAQ